MHRPVRGGVGDVVEEGLIFVMFRMIADVADGVVRDRIGVIPGAFGLILRVVFRSDVAVVPCQAVRVKEGAGAVDRSVEAIEAALHWPVGNVGFFECVGPIGGDVPFACHVGAITRRFQGFRDGDALPVQVALISGEAAVFHHVSDAGLVWVESSQE